MNILEIIIISLLSLFVIVVLIMLDRRRSARLRQRSDQSFSDGVRFSVHMIELRKALLNKYVRDGLVDDVSGTLAHDELNEVGKDLTKYVARRTKR